MNIIIIENSYTYWKSDNKILAYGRNFMVKQLAINRQSSYQEKHARKIELSEKFS